MIKKEVIHEIKNVYTANFFMAGGEPLIAAGSETEPVVRLFHPGSGAVEEIPGCPGGMMSFLPVPGRPDQFVSIMGLFPPFIGKDAGLYLHTRSSGGWSTVKAMELPFAHRCEFIQNRGEVFLLAASVSRHKEEPSDWSLPGELHLVALDSQKGLPWKPEVLEKGIIRNHGMSRAKINGEETVAVSGEEGIFTIHREGSGKWITRLLFQGEVSEMSLLDLDGDGEDELVTIEPFHGDQLSIYKREGKAWGLRFTAPLEFGHGLGAGMYNGVPVVVAGHRSGSLNLEMFSVADLAGGVVSKRVLEAGAGPTQTQVFRMKGRDYILSANQRKHEVALYSGQPA